jgi:hypothetical protein
MQHEDYLKDLAQELRWRRIDDAAVAVVLRDVLSEVAESGATPADRFGDAANYAEQFERGRSLPAGFILATVGALLATLAAAAYAVSSLVGITPSSLPRSLGVYAACLVLMVTAVLAGHQYDRRLPRQLRTRPV